MVCRHCGMEIENDSNFCKGCGKAVMISCEEERVNKTGKKLKGALEGWGGEIISATVNETKDAVSEIASAALNETKDAVSGVFKKAMVKKGRKAADSLLKKMHLKRKTIFDILKEKHKK